MKKIKLTVIIPCYNEKNTILKILNQVEKIKNIKKQIILIDDKSTDGSRELIKKFKFKSDFKLIFHKNNLGKGACIKSAKKYIYGDIVVIQDADLEYSPTDYHKLIKPIVLKKTNIVYGSRVLERNRYKAQNFSSIFRVFANHILTLFSNYINNQNLTDAHTCYKTIRSNIYKKIILKENGFSFCPEITTKISNLEEDIIEVPIKYFGRTYEEGKKISFLDGFSAIIAIIKYKFFKK